MVNKRILMSLIIMVTVIGLASAGTFAYFTDSQSTAANTITAGTLTLNAATINAVTMSVPNAIPTDTDKAFGTPFVVQNTGTTSGILKANLTDISGASDFGNDLKIDIAMPDGTFTPIYQNGAVVPVTLSSPFASSASFTESFRYTYTKTDVPQTQGKTFGFKVTYELRQA